MWLLIARGSLAIRSFVLEKLPVGLLTQSCTCQTVFIPKLQDQIMSTCNVGSHEEMYIPDFLPIFNPLRAITVLCVFVHLSAC